MFKGESKCRRFLKVCESVRDLSPNFKYRFRGHTGFAILFFCPVARVVKNVSLTFFFLYKYSHLSPYELFSEFGCVISTDLTFVSCVQQMATLHLLPRLKGLQADCLTKVSQIWRLFVKFRLNLNINLRDTNRCSRFRFLFAC